ncbi:InlB B-repeat-containing protein, partial [Parabacteroides sp. OttesenSCG-928-N08]|nr:InlB B-repeat-containing protein [Parabacteroides sp. OttesenSCG-928-N08]
MAQNQELWTDVADTEWYDANKTAFDISTPQQLAGVAKLVNEGTTSFAGCTFRLKQDIDLRGKQWVPIGVYNHDGWRIFEGSLDGQGHTIYRLTMDGNDSHQSSFLMGLIGCSEGDITIQDLKLQEVSVNGKDLTIEEFCATGALIAYHSEGILTLHSCHAVSGWVTGGDGNYNTVTGGLVGAIDADIDFLDCSNGLTVTGGEEQDDMSEFGSCTGGLIGATLRSNVIKSCINYGTVIGGSSANNSFTGGLFGLVDRSTVKDCYNTASVTGGEYVAEINVIGGIAGIVFGTSITNCFASGELISGKSGYDFVTGGIVGYLGVDIDKSSSSVSNCLAIQSLIEGKNSDLRSAELQSKALTPSGESVLRPVAPGKQFSSNSLLARGGSSNQDATRIEKREAELRWVPAPVIVTHRIVGYNEDCPLSNNYAYVPGDWNQDEIGTDKLNGAEWSGRMDNAPIDIWDTKIWSIDPVHKLMPKHKWKRTAAVNNPIKFYQVTFNTMGGDDDSQTLFTYCDQPMDEPTAPKKEGYVFNGWFTDNSYQTAWTFGESGDPVTKDM